MENKPSTNLNQPNPNATGFQFSLGNFSFGLSKPIPKKENYDLQKPEKGDTEMYDLWKISKTKQYDDF